MRDPVPGNTGCCERTHQINQMVMVCLVAKKELLTGVASHMLIIFVYSNDEFFLFTNDSLSVRIHTARR